jgi:hypothetical protein
MEDTERTAIGSISLSPSMAWHQRVLPASLIISGDKMHNNVPRRYSNPSKLGILHNIRSDSKEKVNKYIARASHLS